MLELWLPRKIWKILTFDWDIWSWTLFSSRGSVFWCACALNWREPQRREVSEKSIECFREVWTHWNYEGKEQSGQSRWKVAVKFMPGDTLIPENLGGKCTWQWSARTRGQVLPGDPPPLRGCPLLGNFHLQEAVRTPPIQFFCQKCKNTSWQFV